MAKKASTATTTTVEPTTTESSSSSTSTAPKSAKFEDTTIVRNSDGPTKTVSGEEGGSVKVFAAGYKGTLTVNGTSDAQVFAPGSGTVIVEASSPVVVEETPVIDTTSTEALATASADVFAPGSDSVLVEVIAEGDTSATASADVFAAGNQESVVVTTTATANDGSTLEATAETQLFAAGSQDLVEVETTATAQVIDGEEGTYDLTAKASTVMFTPGSQNELDVETTSETLVDIDAVEGVGGGDTSDALIDIDVTTTSLASTDLFSPGSQHEVWVDTDGISDVAVVATATDTDHDTNGSDVGEDSATVNVFVDSSAGADTDMFAPGSQEEMDVETNADTRIDVEATASAGWGDATVNIDDLSATALGDTNLFAAGSQDGVEVDTDGDATILIHDTGAYVNASSDEHGTGATDGVASVNIGGPTEGESIVAVGIATTDMFAPGSQDVIDVDTDTDADVVIDEIVAMVNGEDRENIGGEDQFVDDAHGDASITIEGLAAMAIGDTNLFSPGSQDEVLVVTDADANVEVTDLAAVVDDQFDDGSESGDSADITIVDVHVLTDATSDVFAPGSQGLLEIETEAESQVLIGDDTEDPLYKVEGIDANGGIDGTDSINVSEVYAESNTAADVFSPGAQDEVDVETTALSDIDLQSTDVTGSGYVADADAATRIFVPGGQDDVWVDSDAVANSPDDVLATAVTEYFDPNGGSSMEADAIRNGEDQLDDDQAVVEYSNMESDWFQTGAGGDSSTITREELFDGSTETPVFETANDTAVYDNHLEAVVEDDEYDLFSDSSAGGEPVDDGAPYVFQGSSDYWYDNSQSSLLTGAEGTLIIA